MLWILAAATLLGVLLLALGLVGRVVGDSPHCRACTFDLTGLDLEPAEALCPECGRPLASPRAIRAGRRVRSRRLWVTGLLLALLPLGIAVPIATGQWTKWNTSKPIWVLGLDTDLGSPSIQNAAYDELQRRAILGELDASGNRVFLNAQAARIARGAPLDLGDLPTVQFAHDHGDLSDSRWMRAVTGIDQATRTYLDQFELPEAWGLVRTEDARLVGDSLMPLPDQIDGPTGGLGILIVVGLDEIRIDGDPVIPEPPAANANHPVYWPTIQISKRGRGTGGHLFPSRDRPRFTDARDTLTDLPPGEYELTTTWTLEPFVDASISSTRMGNSTLATATALSPYTMTAKTRVKIARSEPSLIEPITDPARVQAAHDYYTLTSLDENEWGLTSAKKQGLDPITTVSLGIGHSWRGSPGPGVAMVGHFEIEWGEQRVRPATTTPIGDKTPAIVLHPETSGNGGLGRSLLANPPTPRPSTATLVFVPDLDAAPDYAGPWITEHDTPMPVLAVELRWENMPIQWLPEPEDAAAAGQPDDEGP